LNYFLADWNAESILAALPVKTLTAKTILMKMSSQEFLMAQMNPQEILTLAAELNSQEAQGAETNFPEVPAAKMIPWENLMEESVPAEVPYC